MGDDRASYPLDRTREVLPPDHRSPQRNAGILEEIGLIKLPHFTVLREWFETIPIARWRTFLGASVEKRTGHAAVDATGFNRDQPSRHYVQRAQHHVRSLKVTTLVDVERLYVTDIHCTISKKHDAKIGPQVARRNAGDLFSLAVDKGYDPKAFRDELHSRGIRPLIKHRLYSSLDRAHNARMDSARYNRRWMVTTAFSAIKRTLGSAVRARDWFRQFKEIASIVSFHNVERAIDT